MACKRTGGKGGGRGRGKRRKQDGDVREEGERGFLVTGDTCQNALRGAKDFRLWLEVEAPEGEPPVRDAASAEEAGAVEAAPAAAPAAEASAARGLDAELAALRAEGAAGRRFLPIGMVCKQVAFLKAQSEADVPSQLVRQFCAKGAKRPFNSRFAERVLPVDGSSRPKLEAFREMARGLLSPRAGSTWRLEFEAFRGGWNTISREDAMEACRDVLGSEKVSVTDPDVTVLCTLHPRFVGLAALEMDADDLHIGEE
mmetsp:Transcript_94010/g.298475  ORF Transcript_94010/g.298475 Transcript_94010/m.298475 type:complete len:256 (+) Transcript_94010:64-831(+)